LEVLKKELVEKLPNHNNYVHCLKVYDVYVDTVAVNLAILVQSSLELITHHGGFKPLLLLVKILTKHESKDCWKGYLTGLGEIPTTKKPIYIYSHTTN